MTPNEATDWLAWYMMTGFYATVGSAMYFGIPSGESHDIVLMLMTAVVTYTGSVVSFRYGTTTNSERKSDTITHLAAAAQARSEKENT